MLSANALANRFHTYHKYKYSAPNEAGDVKREEDYDDSMLLASIRPPSALFGSEIMPLRPYAPQRSTAAESETATPTARRPLQPAADIANTTQSMKRGNRPPSMDLFGPATVTSVETRDIAMPTGLLDSELPPVSPFFSRITPSDIEEARETVRRASVSRRNTVGSNSHGRGVSWCSPSTAVDSGSSPVLQQHQQQHQQNAGTPTRASIAGTLASWVPPDHHHQIWDPHALESPANRRGQARRHSTWHFGGGEGGSPSSTGSGADDACEWLKDQEPPLSPLFSSYYADKRKKIAAAVLATTTTKAASKDQKEQGSSSCSIGRLFKVDVYTLFSSPLQSASASTRKRPRVVVREFVGGAEGGGGETADILRLVPVDSSDPDVLIAVKRYLSTLVPFGRKPVNKQTASQNRTGMTAPSKLVINGGGSEPSCTTEPAVSFIVSSSTDDGASGGNSISDKAVRSVDVEAMVEAYLPRVYALLDTDPEACRSCPTTVASNNSSMATLTDQQLDSTSYIFQQQACVQNQTRQQRRPFSLSEESLRVASARLPITPGMRIPPPPLPFTDGSRQPAANFSTQAQAMSTPSRQPRSKQPIKSIDQLREVMSSLNLRRGLPAKESGRAAATPAAATTPTNQLRRPSEPPRIHREQQQQQQARRPAVLRRRSEIGHNRDTGREYAPVSQGAIPAAASASKTLPSAFQRTLRPRASFPAHRRSSEEVQLARTSVGSLASMALGSPRSRLSVSSDRSSNTTLAETRPSLTAAASSSRDLPPSTQQQQQLSRRPRAQSSRLDLRSRRDLTPLAPLRNGLAKDNAADPNARGQAIAAASMVPPASAPRTLSRPTLPPLAAAKSSSSSSSPSMVTSRLAARKSMINLNAGNRLSLAAVNGTGGVSYSQHRASYTAGSADRPHAQNAFGGLPTRLPTARRALSGDSQYSGSGSSIASSSYLSPMLTPPVRRSTEGPPPLVNIGVVPQLVSRKLGRRHRLDIRGVFGADDSESSSRSLQNSFGVYPF
ncbi:hypothetical protein IWW48_004481 [Coemansia sp. RSA 1200]|nr:hypothetical protein IWW48_004481 [Coemansia sp. RSA 1200]